MQSMSQHKRLFDKDNLPSDSGAPQAKRLAELAVAKHAAQYETSKADAMEAASISISVKRPAANKKAARRPARHCTPADKQKTIANALKEELRSAHVVGPELATRYVDLRDYIINQVAKGDNYNGACQRFGHAFKAQKLFKFAVGSTDATALRVKSKSADPLSFLNATPRRHDGQEDMHGEVRGAVMKEEKDLLLGADCGGRGLGGYPPEFAR